ncbi:hypothetical protein L1049_023945 [Liquidambar formosana]|uniref:Peptidase A1 domain-containing protein n=1 Tax=Liquidambar formosana TaxID=63359 RepID=A0AAP0X413_LIQFO
MSTSIILLLLLLFFNNAFFFQVQATLSTAAQFELIHRHAPQLSGRGRTLGPPENRLEGVKQLIHSDDARQQMISHRRGLRRRRMMGWEAHSRGDFMKIPMRSAADMGTGQYFVSFRVGSPRPQKVVLIADTGSDLTWMHCNYRCHDCWKKSFLGRAERIFHADLSPSFKTIPCLSNMCKVDLADTFSLSRCPEPMTPCAYDYKYADGSTITGFFANETVTVGLGNSQKIRLHDVVIGCSESWVETSFRELDGIMGLGYGKHSFAVKAAEKFANKFSYCLVDHLSPSNLVNYLSFGNTTSSLLPNMQYTELVLGVISPFYAVNVVGISIGGVMLKIPLQVWDVNGDGGAILDSGSSLTFLTEPAYKPLMAAFEASLDEV